MALFGVVGGRGVSGGVLLFLFAEESAAAHFHAAFFIDADALGGNDVAGFDDVFDLIDAEVCEFRDVDEPVAAWEELHEGTEVSGADDAAGVGGTHFGFGEDVADEAHGDVERFLADGVDVDGAIVFDVDFGAGLGLDAFDDLTARPDEFTDPIWWDLGAFDARGVGAEGRWLTDGGVHHLDDVEPCFASLVDGFLEDAEGDPWEFEVQLVAGDAGFGAAEFEVHVTEVVLAAEDVDHGEVARHFVVLVELADEADGDACDWRGERNAGGEESEDTCAGGGHGGGAIGFHDFTADADGVGEFLLGGEDREDRLLGEGPVTDFATILAAEAPGFADRERREVVVEEEALAVFATGVVVEFLGFVERSEGCEGDRLGFAAGEEGGAVDAREDVDFRGERADFVETATVAALLLVEDGDPEGLFLEVVEGLADFEAACVRVLGEDGGFDLVLEFADGLGAGGFARGVDGGLDAGAGDVVGDFEEFGASVEEFEFADRFTAFGAEFLLGGDEGLDGGVAEVEGLDEFLVRDFEGVAFDHDDLVFRADVDEIDIAVEALGVSWVGDELAVDATDADGAEGFGHREVREEDGGGSAVHGEDVGVVFSVSGEEERDDLGVVEVAFGEERAQRAVRHPAGEDFFFGGAAFAFEVAAWEAACGGGFFFVFDAEREEVLTVLEVGGGDSGDDDHGVAEADGDSAVREAGEFAGFDGDLGGADLAHSGMDTHVICFLIFCF